MLKSIFKKRRSIWYVLNKTLIEIRLTGNLEDFVGALSGIPQNVEFSSWGCMPGGGWSQIILNKSLAEVR